MAEPDIHSDFEVILSSLYPKNDIKYIWNIFAQYSSQKYDFDQFMMKLTKEIDFKQISPLNLLFKMALLDSDDEIVKKFTENSIKYITTLILFPNFIWPSYDSRELIKDFVISVAKNPSYDILFSKIINENTINFFLYMLNHFAFRFIEYSIVNSLRYLEIFYNMLKNNDLALAFCNSDFFYEVMSKLFTKSLLPGSKDHVDIFGPSRFPDISLLKLDPILSIYYENLSNIIVLLIKYKDVCATKMIGFIRKFIANNTETISEDYDLVKGMTLFNFESVIVEVVLKLDIENAYTNLDPYIPYRKNSITPITNDYTLAVAGHYLSWLDKTKIEESKSILKEIFEDNDEDTILDNNKWEADLQKIKTQSADSIISELFFSALKTISISSTKTIQNIQSDYINKYQNKYDILFLQNKQTVFKLLLSSNTKSKSMINFISIALEFILQTARGVNNTGELPSRPPIAFQHLPEYALKVCITLLKYYCNFISAADGSNSDKIYDIFSNSNNKNNKNLYYRIVPVLSDLISNIKYIRNINLLTDIIEVFSLFASNAGLQYIVLRDVIFQKAFPAAINYYSAISKLKFKTGFKMRCHFIDLFKFWFTDSDLYNVRSSLLKAISNNHATAEFFFYLTNDLISVINRFFMLISNSSSSYFLETTFGYVESLFTIIDSFVQNTSISKREKIASNFVKLACLVFHKVLNPKELEINESEIFDSYRPNYFINNFTVFFSTFTDNSVFKNKLIETLNDQNELSLLEDVLQELRKINTNSIESKSFSYFIDDINQINTIIPSNVAIPDELKDPITAELLLDPVKLPSGNIFNMSTLDTDMNSKLIDPITNKAFDSQSQVIPEDIKERANEFYKNNSVQIKK